MNRNETPSSSSGQSNSDESYLDLDDEKQTPKNEYTRSQLMELRHDDTHDDMLEKAKNMQIAERIIKKNAERKLAEAKNGGSPTKGAAGGPIEKEKKGIDNATFGPVINEKPKEPKEPNVDDFWSKATTTSSKRNAAADQNKNFALANPWDKSGYDDPTDFGFRTSSHSKAKVDHWLSGNEKTPTQFSQGYDDFSMESSPSKPSKPMMFPKELKRTDTSSVVSDVSVKSSARLQLLDKTAKLKETLSKLKKQNPKN